MVEKMDEKLLGSYDFFMEVLKMRNNPQSPLHSNPLFARVSARHSSANTLHLEWSIFARICLWRLGVSKCNKSPHRSSEDAPSQANPLSGCV